MGAVNGGVAAFLGRHPLFGAALAAVVCVVLAGRDPALGWLGALLAGLAALAFAGWRCGLGWLCCGAVAVAVFNVRSAGRDRAERGLAGWADGPVVAEILENPGGGDGFWAAPARLQNGPFAGARVRWQGRWPAPVAGSTVRARGEFRPPAGPRNPGEFDEARWLRGQGIAAVFLSRDADAELSTGRLAAFGANVRAGFRTAVTAGLDDDSRQARVIRAVVLGEHPQDGGELAAPFRHSGTLHVFSVSGLHVGMVGAIGWLVLSWLGVPRRWAVIGLLPLVFGYAWLTGNGAPAVRASWMMAVFFGAFVFRRQPDVLNALGAVLLVSMLWDGRLLFQPGVQLSYGVVAAIAIGVSWASRGFGWLQHTEAYLPESLMSRPQRWWLTFRKWLAQSLAVSTAAWAGSTPLTAAHFGLITPVSIPATVALVPMVFVLLAAALGSAALHPLWPRAAEVLNQGNGRLAETCARTAAAFAAIPGSHIRLNRARTPFLLVYDLPGGAGAACFSAGTGGAVLIDCGDRRGFRGPVLASLRHFDVVPDSVVLTHPDGAHLGGGVAVWEELPIRQALVPVGRALSPAYRAWLAEAPAAGVKLLHAGDVAELPFPDDARLEIVHRPDSGAVSVSADDRVAVYRLHWRGWKILFTSDAGHLVERALLTSGKDIAADVIISGRHRADANLGDEFLDAVNPRAIIASNAAHPPEERLPESQAAYWRSRGIHLVDQGKTGGVTVKVERGGAMAIRGFVDGSELRLEQDRGPAAR